MKPYWLIKLPRGRLAASRDVTWGDVQACIAALNAASEDVFAGLHRCEGGFMCVEGPGFRSDERVDSALPHQNPDRIGAAEKVHKEIRFARFDGARRLPGLDWPSYNCSFLGDHAPTDDWVVLDTGDETHLTFEGAHCVPWTRKECEAYARVVAETLGLVQASAPRGAREGAERPRPVSKFWRRRASEARGRAWRAVGAGGA